ncbi:MAG: hypothetical protein M1594_02420 [Candidatus Marsarchaeota archaeon]|nr:hypothetical protein [Candidatus Marsarchaeota archaeon]
MLDLIQLIGLMPFITKPMFEYVENVNSNVWVNKTVYGVVGVFDAIGDAEPGIYLNQTFLNSSSNLTVFYGLSITKPLLDFKEDCDTKRFLYSVSYSLENNGIIDSNTSVLNLDFNDFNSYSLNKRITTPISIAKNENISFYFNAEVVFKIEHWHLTPHISCSKDKCSVYYSCDYAGATYAKFQNSTSDSKQFFVLNESPSVEYNFDYYYGVRELKIKIKGDDFNFALKSNGKSFDYYSIEYPVFIDSDNFSHVTLSQTDVYFENGIQLLKKSVGNYDYNFSFLNVSPIENLTVEFPFYSKNFTLSDNQINSSVELSIPEFNSPGSIVNASVELTDGAPLNGSVSIEEDGSKFNVSVVYGIGFFSFEMPNSSVLINASFEKNGFYSSSDEKMVLVKTSYSSEIILLSSFFLLVGYGFTLVSGVRSKTLIKLSGFFIFIVIILFVLSNLGWTS